MSIRPKTAAAILVASPLLLALSACGDDAEPTVENDGREASGEVLEGTISDEMLPLDQVRSQAPLMEQAEDAAGSAPGDATADTSADAPADAVETEAGTEVED
ncbi:hypothetical protein [Aurantiacibacter hainanensis]|uniref:hypothetical protein n=1 Tax=Aurantiacibacter hainanensis TaxID=3076114 RepID=UPI0030C73B6D